MATDLASVGGRKRKLAGEGSSGVRSLEERIGFLRKWHHEKIGIQCVQNTVVSFLNAYICILYPGGPLIFCSVPGANGSLRVNREVNLHNGV